MQLREADEKGNTVAVGSHLLKSHVPDWQDSDSDESDGEGDSHMPPTPAAALTTSHVAATPTTVKPSRSTSTSTSTTSSPPSAATTSITTSTGALTSSTASRRVDVVIRPTSWTSRHIQAALTIEAPLEVVWGALTDYDHLHTFIPGLVENRRLERRPAGCLLFQKSSQHIALGVRFAAGVTLDIQEYPAGLPPALAAAPGAHDYTHKYPVPSAAVGSTTSSQTSTNSQPADGGSSSRDGSRSTTSTAEEQACQAGTGGTRLQGLVPRLDALNLGDAQLAQESAGGEPAIEHSSQQPEGVQPQPGSRLQVPDAGGSDPAAVGLTSSSSADITFTLVKGDFAAFKGIWRMQRHPAAPDSTMRLSYAVYVQPQPWLPVALVQGRIEREIMANLRAVAAYAEGQAVALGLSAAEGPAGSS